MKKKKLEDKICKYSNKLNTLFWGYKTAYECSMREVTCFEPDKFENCAYYSKNVCKACKSYDACGNYLIENCWSFKDKKKPVKTVVYK